MSRQQQVSEVFVEMADTLVDDFDIIDFLQKLSARCVELLDVSAAGILLADSRGDLQIIAASDENTRLLELFALQHDQGPCVECYTQGAARLNIDLTDPVVAQHWPLFADRACGSGYATTHALPLRLRHHVMGALNLFHTERAVLGVEDTTLAQALADIATIGILQQRTLEQSQTERSQLQAALTSRIVIEQSKGILAERLQTSPDHAFATIRAHARTHHLRISELARQIVDGDAPGLPVGPGAA
ncbi:GAF and ANTAR domain-containing protein [Streptomyces olivoverticillatus]